MKSLCHGHQAIILIYIIIGNLNFFYGILINSNADNFNEIFMY